MKNLTQILLTTTLALLLLPQLCLAQFTVIPGQPYDRKITLQIEPGKSETSSIIIKNVATVPLTLDIYGADATNSNQGTFALTGKARDQHHIGTWVTFKEPLQTLEPDEEKTIPFVVSVPADATPGNYGGGIAVESAPPSSTQEDQPGVSVNSRIYVQLFVSIPGEKIHSYEWKDFSFLPVTDGYNADFSNSYKNTGNTIVIADPVIDIKGFPPVQNSQIDLPKVTIQPGYDLDNIIAKWDSIPWLGMYTVTASTTFYEYDIINDQNINPQIITKTLMINLTPWFLICGILGLIAALIIFCLVRAHIKDKFKKSCKSYLVKEDETITSIAEDRGIAWKKLAKLNRLKPPYSLKPGQKILVPPKS